MATAPNVLSDVLRAALLNLMTPTSSRDFVSPGLTSGVQLVSPADALVPAAPRRRGPATINPEPYPKTYTLNLNPKP